MKRLNLLVLLILVGGLPLGMVAAQNATGTAEALQSIRRKLVSDDFREREEGTAELARLPVSQIDALRTAEKVETDDEARARMRKRIEEMEVYVMLHPPNLSIEARERPFSEIAAKLQEQVGMEFVSPGAPGQTFTVNARNVPFWEIMVKMSEQSPFLVAGATTLSDKKAWVTRMRIIPANAPTSWVIKDAFAIIYEKRAQPTSTGWNISATVAIDPRLRISEYDQRIRVEKIVSPKGDAPLREWGSATPKFSSLARPTVSCTVSVPITGDPNTTRLAELRGTVVLKIAERDRKFTINLTKAQHAQDPIETSIGIIRLTSAEPGSGLLTVIAPDGSPIPSGSMPLVSLLFHDKDGNVVRSSSSRTNPILLSPGRDRPADGVAGGPLEAASVEVSFPEKAREYVLPVELKDIELPPMLPPGLILD